VPNDEPLILRIWDEQGAAALSEWRQVLAIAKKQKATLGFLPDSAFGDRARAGRLLIAARGEQVLGYTLFDLPRSGQIKLRHVCADPSARGLNLGLQMIDRIAELHPSATGMIADCRQDYGLEGFWTKARFTPRSERKGRAAGGSILVVWWRQLAQMDLFDSAMALEPGGIAVLDTNVVSDLYAPVHSARANRDVARALPSAALDASVMLVVSPQVDLELSRIEDPDSRRSQQERSQELVRLRQLPAADELATRLIDLIGVDVIASDSSLRDDLVHIADAIANDAKYFVTNDEPLLKHARALVGTEWGLELLRPHQFVERLYEDSSSPIYESRLIETLNLKWQPTKNYPDRLLENAFLIHGEERATEFRRTLRASIANGPGDATVLEDDKGELWALLATSTDETALSVNLLRTRVGRRSSTLALQIARLVRARAAASGVREILIPRSAVTEASARLLTEDGFTSEGGDLTGRAEGGVLNIDIAASRWGTGEELDAFEIADLERRYWPLTIAGAGLPVYVVPIQPRFAAHLFGLSDGPGLFDIGSADLGLSRENVYYSGSPMTLPPGPGRILWYVSKDATGTTRQLAAYSRMIESARLAPDEAYSRFRHLGVFKRDDVRGVADKSGKVHVVRFEDTVILRNPIGRTEMESMFEKHGTTSHLLSLRAASPELFDEVVRREMTS
jgi:hypothetical protein